MWLALLAQVSGIFFLVVLHDERGLHGISLVFGPPESVFLAALAIVGLVAS